MYTENTRVWRNVPVCLSVLLCFISIYHCCAQGAWTPLANAAPNRNYGVMLLLTDGSVLVKTDTDSHGFDCSCPANPGDTWNKLTPDSLGSYANGTWTTIAHMADTRIYFASQVMPNGQVYVAGGEYGTGETKAEVYNPLTDTWTAITDPTPDTILDGNSQLLPDGRILQAVAINPDTHTLIYNPSANTFSPGPTVLGVHSESTWLLLKDNSILFGDRVGNTSERYIPATGNWVADAPTLLPLYDQATAETGSSQLLPNGNGVFFGGSGNVLYYTPSGTASPGSWIAGPNMPAGLGAPDGASATMTNGKILCVMSDTNTATASFLSPTYFYEFDYVTGAWTPVTAPVGGDTLTGPCTTVNMLDLPDGNVLVCYYGSNQYYVYTPTGTPLPAGKPAVDTIIKISCTKYMATGTLFNGISQGAAFGDDWQMATNYPLVRLTLGAKVYYARTYNWNSTGVMRGSAADTTYFDLPSALPEGTYHLEVVTNGYPSAARIFNTCGVTDVPETAESKQKIRVSPNPSAEYAATVFYSDAAGPYTAGLTDITGRTVLLQAGLAAAGENTCTLRLDDLPNGMYIVFIATSDGVQESKLVKE